jgi:hypothetical protein
MDDEELRAARLALTGKKGSALAACFPTIFIDDEKV